MLNLYLLQINVSSSAGMCIAGSMCCRV